MSPSFGDHAMALTVKSLRAKSSVRVRVKEMKSGRRLSEYVPSMR